MIHTRDHKTANIFDQWGHLGPKRRKLLTQSWAGLFREHILEELPVDKLAPYFHESHGRPTKEMYAAIGAIVLQQAHDLTDEETVLELAFNEAWHFALDIPDESDGAKYICTKTLWNIRKVITDNELDTVIFDQITSKLAVVFGVDTKKQRLDSVHIKSDMRRMSRLGIFVKAIKKFLVNLKRQHRGLFDELDEELVEKYLSKGELGCFSSVKPSESKKKLPEVAQDLFELVKRFADKDEVVGMSSFNLLTRVLEEQCVVTESKSRRYPGRMSVSVRPAEEVSSDSLQNPSDPDASYDGHKGQGYQVQIMETYSEEVDPTEKKKTLNLITHVEVEPAHKSDANALMPAIKSAMERKLGPEELLADTLYGSDENVEAARKKGVEVVAPTMGKSSDKSIALSDFEFNDKGSVTKCPGGHAPKRVKRNGERHTAAFEERQCANCPFSADCPAKPGKKKRRYLRYDNKALRLAKRRGSESGQAFRERYRYRAGVEATMSEYDRSTGAKQLRVRGMPSVRMAAKLKACAINLFRATRVRNALNAGENARKVCEVYPEIVLDGAVSDASGATSALANAMTAIWNRVERFFDPAYAVREILVESA